MTELNIFLENLHKSFDIDETALYKNVIKMTEFILSDSLIITNSCLNGYKFKSIDFDIVFVDNDEIQRINSEYRKKDMPTDVITFAMFADSMENERYVIDDEISLGEIIVSLDKIKTQAQENNTEFNDELYFIISHGILHLLGFDHLNEGDYNFMINWQNKAKAVVL